MWLASIALHLNCQPCLSRLLTLVIFMVWCAWRTVSHICLTSWYIHGYGHLNIKPHSYMSLCPFLPFPSSSSGGCTSCVFAPGGRLYGRNFSSFSYRSYSAEETVFVLICTSTAPLRQYSMIPYLCRDTNRRRAFIVQVTNVKKTLYQNWTYITWK